MKIDLVGCKNVGYTIIKHIYFTDSENIVLAKRTTQDGETRFATWNVAIINQGESFVCNHGHYTESETKALKDFWERVATQSELMYDYYTHKLTYEIRNELY